MDYTVHVSSSQRSSGTNTNFNINFPQIMNLLSKKGMFQIIFNNAQIPFTFYQLNNSSSLNVITIGVTFGSSSFATNITLSQGNYTPYTLITELNNRLYDYCFATCGFKPQFGTAYDPTTGYITFSLVGAAPYPVGGGTISISLNFNLSPNPKTAYFFGSVVSGTTSPLAIVFSATFNSSGVITSYVNASSNQPCVLNPINYLLIRSSLKQYRNREYIVQSDTSDIVYKVPISTVQSSWINYYQVSEPLYIVDNSIQSINFYFTSNQSYTPINLQNIPWAFSFTIREVIRPDYEALNAFTSIPSLPLQAIQEEKQALEMEKEKQLARLELYKKKLQKAGIPESSSKKIQDNVVE